MKNTQILLSSRPEGIPTESNFRLADSEISEKPTEGNVLLKNLYLSIDPAMRGWVSEEPNYLPPVAIDEVMRSVTVAEVIASNSPDVKVGEIVSGLFGWQNYCETPANTILKRIDPELAPVSTALGPLGNNGITAYLALTEKGQLKAGDTVLVSTAAGGVGSIAGQVAKAFGATVIGLTGSDEKVELCLNRFSYDHAINYKTCQNLTEEILEVAPQGIDLYLDNTSGSISDAVYPALALNARVVQNGTAAIASWEPTPGGPRRDRHILTKRLTISGFVLIDYFLKFAETTATLAQWYTDGKLNYEETITEGLENAPKALEALYEGSNLGKQIIKL